FSSTGFQPKRCKPLSNASMPRSPSNVGGRRSSSRKPNFSCSVPIRQSADGLDPDARYSTSASRPVIGATSVSAGPDMRASATQLEPVHHDRTRLVDALLGFAGERLHADHVAEGRLQLA